MFRRSAELSNKLVVKNLQISGYEEIRIYIRHKVQLEFENCIFKFAGNKGIIIYFDNDILTSSEVNKSNYIKFTGCQFINTCQELSNESAYQVQFRRDLYPANKEGSFLLSNIFIENSKFHLSDYPESHSKSFNSIIINRMSESDYVNNIFIRGNQFDFKNMNYAHTGGIILQNANPGCNYSNTKNDYYKKNMIIKIKNNHIRTDSDIPAQAIFIQGPFDSTDISENIISGFSGILRTKDLAIPDGDIHLYGARGSLKYYSDDNKNVTISNNILYSRGIGIKVSGGNNVEIGKNIIYMLPLPGYWRNDNSSRLKHTGRFAISSGTGNPDDPEKQARRHWIIKNKIYGNFNLTDKTLITDNCGGIILFSPRDFSVTYNHISATNNYGIVYFKHASQTEQSFGKSSISFNLIDYQNQYISSLKSVFYSNYNSPFAAINVQREFHNIQNTIFEEELTIEKNRVFSIDKTINPIIFYPGNAEKLTSGCKYNVK